MNGKTLEVVEYNLTYGTSIRKVNVFSLFRYKKNNNLYVIYTDVDTKYEIIYYGSSHIKNNSILSMACKEEEGEIIKEYIYKLTNNNSLEDFEIIDIRETSGIEIVSSNKLEIKLEIIRQLEDLTIEKPKIEIEEEIQLTHQQKNKKNKKKNSKLIIILLIITALGGGIFYLTTIMNSNKIAKKVTCTKIFKHETLNATVEETNVYNFINNDILKNIDTTSIYTFDSKRDYETFINSGNVYKYPEDNPASSYEQNALNNSVKYISEKNIDTSYSKPTEYETLINYYIKDGYNCSEQIER